MKKLPVTILVFLTAGIFCLLTDPLSATEDTSGKFAVLADISGNVEISHDGTASWQAIHQGDFLAEGDWIQTTSGSKATIGFDPDLLNTVTLQESSRARVDQLRNTMTLQLPAGTVTSLMNGLQPGEEFQVQTPTAVIGVRGTGFIIQVAPGGQTTVVQVEEGKVEVQQTSGDQPTQSQPTEATPGQSLEVTATSISKKPEDPQLDKVWQEYQRKLKELKRDQQRKDTREPSPQDLLRRLKQEYQRLKEAWRKVRTEYVDRLKELKATKEKAARKELYGTLRDLNEKTKELSQKIRAIERKIRELQRRTHIPTQAPVAFTAPGLPSATQAPSTAGAPVAAPSVTHGSGRQAPLVTAPKPVEETDAPAVQDVD